MKTLIRRTTGALILLALAVAGIATLIVNESFIFALAVVTFAVVLTALIVLGVFLLFG